MGRELTNSTSELPVLDSWGNDGIGGGRRLLYEGGSGGSSISSLTCDKSMSSGVPDIMFLPKRGALPGALLCCVADLVELRERPSAPSSSRIRRRSSGRSRERPLPEDGENDRVGGGGIAGGESGSEVRSMTGGRGGGVCECEGDNEGLALFDAMTGLR